MTIAAHLRGWEAFEPITLPVWDLQLPEARVQAREYTQEVDPDFVALAPPCGPWSKIQLINQRTPLQVRDLQRS